MIYQTWFKRGFDICLSALLLLLTSPLIFIGYTAIRLSSPGSGFFLQERVGRSGKPFQIYKLRTMSVDPNRKLDQTFGGDPDVLAAGRILRRLKLDELPQIYNVLIGDMSFVGPRPCMAETAEEMPEWARRRFDIRPGITGLAQVSGNVALSWEERWQYDVRYVENCTLKMDAGILLKTVLVVLMGEERFRSAP